MCVRVEWTVFFVEHTSCGTKPRPGDDLQINVGFAIIGIFLLVICRKRIYYAANYNHMSDS